jgi:hypothetical protein
MMSFSEIREMVCNAICAKEGKEFSCYVVDIFTDQVVYESRGADGVEKCYQRSYSIVDGVVTLGDAVAVEKQIEYTPITASCQFLTAVEGDMTGNLWNVRIMEFGLSKDGRLFFTKDKIQAAVAKFDGAHLFALRSGQHQDAAKFGKPPVDIVGMITKPEIRNDGLYGQVAFLPTGYGLRDNLKAAREMGVADPYGLSVDVDAKAAVIMMNGKKVLSPLEIHGVTVDVVYDPASKGEFLQMAAAVQAGREEDVMIKKLLAAILTTNPALHTQITAGIEAKTMTEDEAITRIAAATVTNAGGDAGNTHLVAAITTQLQQLVAAAQPGTNINQETQVLACEMRLGLALSDSGLPKPAQDHIRGMYVGKIFAAAELDTTIKSTKQLLDASIVGTGLVIEAGQLRASVTVDQRDKHAAMLDDFFAGNVASFKACYQDITGDMLVTGRIRDAVRLQASVDSTTFAEFLGDSITRRALAEYKLVGLDDWKKICDIVPLGDFRTQHRPRMGGYGNLPIVLERGEYEPLTTPGDEEATYAPAKRGGTEDISLETIKNDDVGIIRQVPRALGRSSAWTLYEFVFGFIDANPVIYDADNLFSVAHGNLGSAALDATSLKARRLAMMKRAQLSSGKRLAIVPKIIMVPADLEDTAYALTVQPNAGNFTPTAADAIRRQTWEIITVLHWTDATNWYLAADKGDVPLIEIGFLDNKQEPEFFVQDLPNVGSMFSNDILTYKIRHVYGGGVMDYRGLDGSVVAG